MFITDHNVVSRESRVRVANRGAGIESPVLCPGIEVSAWRAHIVLLGDSLPVDQGRYNSSLRRAADSAARAATRRTERCRVASLPEYRRNHWNRLDTLVAAGLDGFEIVNASPKANELTRAQRDSVIALARASNRFVIGVSDSHGWGATSMVWNLVRAPRGESRRGHVQRNLRRLKDGFPSRQIVERHRLRPDAWWPMWLTPIGMVWETWRSMGWALTAGVAGMDLGWWPRL